MKNGEAVLLKSGKSACADNIVRIWVITFDSQIICIFIYCFERLWISKPQLISICSYSASSTISSVQWKSSIYMYV